MLDRAKAMGACPGRLGEAWGLVEAENDDEGKAMKSTSIRLTADQSEALERLAPILTATRPDLAGLAGNGGLTPYSVLRVAIALGIRALEDQVDEAARLEAMKAAGRETVRIVRGASDDGEAG